MGTIAFIGAGNMATAIIRGYLGRYPEAQITAYDIQPDALDRLASCGVTRAGSAAAAASGADILVLAVKPQSFPALLEELRGNVGADTVVVSIAAGITAEFLRTALGFRACIVTAMPNTPMLLGEGATALARHDPTSEEQFAQVYELFAASGMAAVIDAGRMNEVIPVNGSAPAFIYEITKEFVENAVRHGIGRDEALALFCQTLHGAAKMMTDSGYDLDTLTEMVSSKGGTTIAGLEALRSAGLGNVIKNGYDACVKRAYELSK